MDLTPYAGWIVFGHVLGAFMFAAGHGVSMFVVFQARKEADRGKLTALLDLSGYSLGVAGIGMLLVLAFGILGGIVLGSWNKYWIWTALVLFIVVGGAMTPIGVGYLGKLRVAIGQRPRNAKKDDPDPVPATDDELAAIRVSRAPELLLTIGVGGFVVILYLMMFKPF